MNGIYLIDKPSGITSFDCIRRLRKILNTKKIGHAGTLDPFATGLLVILVGKATKLSDYLLSLDKVYEGVIFFGKSTDTLDLTGKTTRIKEHYTITEDNLKKAFKSLNGAITQIPPKYSAIKIDGRKLYEYAREGKDIELPKRDVFIHKFYPTTKLIDHEIGFYAHTSKGTYIRSLSESLGNALDVPTHLSKLRRTRSGVFKIEDAFSLDEINQDTKPTISLHEFAGSLPKVIIKPYLEMPVLNGIYLDHRQTDLNEMFSVYNEKGSLLAIYTPINHQYKPIIILGEPNETI